jgi:hypothetical protein
MHKDTFVSFFDTNRHSSNPFGSLKRMDSSFQTTLDEWITGIRLTMFGSVDTCDSKALRSGAVRESGVFSFH